MSDLTVSVSRPCKGEKAPWQYGCVGYTDYQSGSTAYTIYKGGPVMIDDSDVDGYAQPFTSSITCEAADVFLGIALEEASVTSAETAQPRST
jgi:hypothetical protein